MQKLGQIANSSSFEGPRKLAEDNQLQDGDSGATPDLGVRDNPVVADENGPNLGDHRESLPLIGQKRGINFGARNSTLVQENTLKSDEGEPMLPKKNSRFQNGGFPSDELLNKPQHLAVPHLNISNLGKGHLAEPLSPFVVGKDKFSKDKNVVLIRPSSPRENLGMVDHDHLKETGIKAVSSFGEAVIAQDLTQLSIKQLLQRVIPSINELSSRGYPDQYSKKLVDICANDSFVKRQNTEVYKELEKRMDHVTLTNLLLTTKSLEDLRQSTVSKLTTDEIITRLILPEVRPKIIGLLTELTETENLQQKLANLEMGNFKWQNYFALTSSIYREKVVDCLIKDHHKSAFDILEKQHFYQKYIDSHGLDSFEVLNRSLTEINMKNLISEHKDELDSVLKKYELDTFNELFFKVLSNANALEVLREVIRAYYLTPNDNKVEETIGSVMFLLFRSVEAKKLASALKDSNLFKVMADILATGIICGTRKKNEVGILGITALKHCSAENFLNQVIRELPEFVVADLRLKCLSPDDYDWVLATVEPSIFGELLNCLPLKDLHDIALDTLSIEILTDSSISQLNQRLQTLDMYKLTESSTCCRKKYIDKDGKTSTTANQTRGKKFDQDEQDYEAQHGHKPDKLVEADPSMLEDYWHEGNPNDGLGTLPNSHVVGYHARLATLKESPFCLLMTSNRDRIMPTHSALVDSKTGKLGAWLPGVYLAFVENRDKLVTFQFINSSSDTRETGLEIVRNVIIYDFKTLPNLNIIEQYSTIDPVESLFKEVNLAASYTSACEANFFGVRMLYCDDSGNCRALLKPKTSSQFTDTPAPLHLPTSFARSSQCHYYFYDWSTRLVVVDRHSKQLTVFAADISLDADRRRASVAASVYAVVNLAALAPHASLGDMEYDGTTRDPLTMAYTKTPIVVFDQFTAYEVLLDKDLAAKKVETERTFVVQAPSMQTDRQSGGHLKQVIQLDKHIKRLDCYGDYIFMLTSAPKTGRRYLTIAKKTKNTAQILAELDAKDYDTVAFNGKIVILQDSESEITQVTSFCLDLSKYAILFDRKATKNSISVSHGRYGYLQDNKIFVRHITNDSLLHEFEVKTIIDEFEINFNECYYMTFNTYHTKALLIYQKEGNGFPDGNKYWFFGVDIEQNNFYKIDLKTPSYSQLKVNQSHIILDRNGTVEIYYFDEEGRLQEVDSLTVPIEGEHGLQQARDAWLYKMRGKAVVGFKGKVLDSGEHLKDAALCRQPCDSQVMAVYTKNDILVYDITDLGKNDAAATVKKFDISGVKSACIDSTGVLCYALVFDRTVFVNRVALYHDQQAVFSKKVLDLGIQSFNSLSIEFNHECSCVMVKYDSGNTKEIKVISTKHDDLLYTIDDEVKNFPHEARQLRAIFNYQQFFMLAEQGQSILRVDYLWKSMNRRERIGNFRLSLFYYYLAESEGSKEDKDRALANIDNFFSSNEPMSLVRERAIFVILANMKKLEPFQLFLNHCSLRKLVLHGNLLEWLFSNIKQGRWLRNFVLEKFDEAFYAIDGDVDGVDPDLFDNLVMYRYTPKLLKEPAGRGIFLRLMRAPVFRSENGEREPYLVDLNANQLDDDYDTSLLLNLGNTGLLQERAFSKEIKRLNNRLKRMKGNNIVAYQLYISSTPLQLSLGNPVCIELFRLLDQCPSEEVLEYLRPVVYLQWSNLYWLAFGYMLLWWTYAALCYAFYGFMVKSYGLGIAIIAMSVFFLAYEVLSLKSHGKRFLSSAWNSVDLIAIIACIVTVPMMWRFNVETQGWAVGRSIVLIVVWIRGLTLLKVIRSIRYLMTMVLRVFNDMIAYLVILTLSVIGLAFVWRLSSYFPPEGDIDFKNPETYLLIPSFFSSVQGVTNFIMGNSPESEADGREFSVMRYLVAVALGIIMALALTNLLIAIINQTYADIEETKKTQDLQEVIDLIVDFNGSVANLFNCKWFERRQYVVSIDSRLADDIDVDLHHPACRAKRRGGGKDRPSRTAGSHLA